MTMTKTLILSWIPPNNDVDAFNADQERLLKLMEMVLDGKTIDIRKIIKIKENTLQRSWRDQAAVEEYVEFMHYLADKYKGTVVVGAVKDI